MGNNNSGILVLLFLALALLLAVPLLFLSGAMPALSYRDISIAATAGLFIIPVLFVFLAAIILASRRKGVARPAAQARYPWDNIFPETKDAEVALPKRSSFVKKDLYVPVEAHNEANFRPLLVVFVAILVVIGLVFLSQHASIGKASNSTNSTVQKAENASLHENQKPGFSLGGSVKNLPAKLKGLGGRLGYAIQMVPLRVWQLGSVVVLAAVLIGALVVSHRTGQLGETGEWFSDIFKWVGSAPSAVRSSSKVKKIALVILVIAATAALACFVFRKQLAEKVPGLSNLPSAITGFAMVYRLYIVIGVLTLAVVIGTLMIMEKRPKGKK